MLASPTIDRRLTSMLFVGGFLAIAALASSAHWLTRLAAGAIRPGAAKAVEQTPTGREQAAAQHVRDLAAVILNAKTVRLEAFASVSLLGATTCGAAPPGSTGWGRFQYVAMDDRYRLDTFVDPEVFPGMQASVAFDGQQFGYLHSNGVLTISDADNTAPIPSLPNPLLELLLFMTPAGEAGVDRMLHLRDLRRAALPSPCELATVAAKDRAEPLVRLTFSGAPVDSHLYLSVYVAAADQPRIVRADRVADGRVLTRSEFSDHEPLRGVMLPRRVKMTGFDVDGSVGAEVEMSITELAIDEPLGPDCFSISAAEAVAVWDDLRREFATRGQ